MCNTDTIDLDYMFVNITVLARQILVLPIVTEAVDYSSTVLPIVTEAVDYSSTVLPIVTEAVDYSSTNPPAAEFNMTGLVTGLIAAVAVILFLLIILAGIMVSFCKFHQTRR